VMYSLSVNDFTKIIFLDTTQYFENQDSQHAWWCITFECLDMVGFRYYLKWVKIML
jgi:hypothetical protein